MNDKLKVILTKGLPASGKSTWAKDFIKNNKEFKRVNKDDLRAMIDDSVFSKENEKNIVKARDTLILMFLNSGYNVIVDDTNLHHKHFQNISSLVKDMAVVEVNDSFLDVPVEECIRRDNDRENSVGEKVILSMYKSIERVLTKDEKRKHWEKTNIKEGMLIAKPREFDKKLPFCIIVDMDGTLSMMNGRSPYEFKKCIDDLPNYPVIGTVRDYHDSNRGKIFIVSGREDIALEETKQWLKKFNVYYDGIFMRKEGDRRNDVIVKKEIYDREFNGKYNVDFVLDDRTKVVKMWREQDVTCYQVAEGDF